MDEGIISRPELGDEEVLQIVTNYRQGLKIQESQARFWQQTRDALTDYTVGVTHEYPTLLDSLAQTQGEVQHKDVPEGTKVLVTGAKGIIGANLVYYLLAYYPNIQVVSVVREGSLGIQVNNNRNFYITTHLADPRKVYELLQAEKPTHIINLADNTPKNMVEGATDKPELLQNILTACANSNVRLFNASSTDLENADAKGGYVERKQAQEKLLENLQGAYSIRIPNLNIMPVPFNPGLSVRANSMPLILGKIFKANNPNRIPVTDINTLVNFIASTTLTPSSGLANVITAPKLMLTMGQVTKIANNPFSRNIYEFAQAGDDELLRQYIKAMKKAFYSYARFINGKT